ncbi:mitochondrial import protein Pam17, partial [Amniculicola lignicola CBS 123094]
SNTPSSHHPSSSNSGTQLTWNRFLELRRTRRRISVVASSASAIATTYVGLTVFVRGSYDGIMAASVGLDPIVVTGLSAFAMMGVGWLIGPVFGGWVFNVMNSGVRGDIERKEKAFYDRIKAHRVDPTSSSIANPVPDYYGEKIGSVADYRKWLKDQRAFNLKRGAYAGRKS